MKYTEAVSLYHIREASFHSSEIPEPTQTDKYHEEHGEPVPRPVDERRSAGDSPAESFNDPGHGVEGVEHAPLFRNYAATETDRRDIQPELDHERDYVAKVPVLHIECRNPEAAPERKD